jgi:hypothetical protein
MMLMSVETSVDIKILYFEGCPNHVPAIDLVKQVVAKLGIETEIEEVEITGPEDVETRRFLGSPTIQVNGIDIDPEARERTDYSFSCRVYSGVSGLPPEAMIAAALQQ